jgi:lipopolysaccharide export system permease protein
MYKINQYLLRHLFGAFLLVAFGLTAAVWLTQSLRFIEVVLNKGFPLVTFFQLVVLMLPDLFTIVMPISLFVGVLFIYNRLINDSELVVMRSVGFSDFQLARPGIMLGLMVMGVMFFINLYVLPESFKRFRDLEYEIRNGASMVLFNGGEFTTLGDVTIFVREKKGSQNLKGIFIYDGRDKANPYTLMAAQGGIKQTDDGAKILLVSGSRQSLPAKTSNVPQKNQSTLYFDQYIFEFKVQQKSNEKRVKKPYEMSLSEQLWPGSEVSPQQRSKMKIEAHQKLIWPFYGPILALIALAFLLNERGYRRGRPRHLGQAVLWAVSIQAGTFGLLQLSDRFPITLYLAYGLLLLSLFMGLLFLSDSPLKNKIRNYFPKFYFRKGLP